MSSEGRDFERAIKYWTVPNQASTDLITPKMNTQALKVAEPRSGKRMAGIVLNGDHWSEYATVKLLQPLMPGKKYFVEFWMSQPLSYKQAELKPGPLHDYFGAWFTPGMPYFHNKKIIKAEPQIRANAQLHTAPGKWTKIFGTFIPDTTCHYITIGQFIGEDKSIITAGYWCLDDVFVEAYSSAAVDYTPSRYFKIDGSNASINVDNIYFEYNKATLLPESFEELDKLVTLLKKNPSITIDIEGHTDAQGTEEYNKALSEARAKSVEQYLIKKGIPEKRLESKGYGKSKPIAGNDNESGRQQNRRVEFIIKGDIDPGAQAVTDVVQVYPFSNGLSANDVENHAWLGIYPPSPVLCGSKPVDKIQAAKYPNGYKPTPASEYVLSKTSAAQITMINLPRHSPQPGAWVYGLLEQLQKQGYKYLVMESIVTTDTDLKSRGYPTLGSGTLTRMPIYGELVRKAISLGLVPYAIKPSTEEVDRAKILLEKQGYTTSDPSMLMESARQWAKAMNLNRLLAKEKGAKVLVLSEAESIRELPEQGYTFMAAWIKKLIKTDPLTIDAAHLLENCADKEWATYSLYSVTQPSVLINASKTPYVDPILPAGSDSGNKMFDIQVLFPRSKYYLNRPDWVSLNNSKTFYTLNPDKHGLKYPSLVLVYKDGEDTDLAVPTDVVEINAPDKIPAVVLHKGVNNILIIKDGMTMKKLEITP